MKKYVSVTGFVYDNVSNHSFGVYTQLKKDGMITLTECKDIYDRVSAKILKENEYIKKIEIDLSKYFEYNEDGTPVYSSEENPFARDGSKKVARYHVKENMLRIWENDLPIYENANGVICNDVAVLADGLC